MRMPQTNEPENKGSVMLSPEQNTQIFRLLGLRSLSICTTVVQLFTTYPPHHAQWHQKATGVLCFVKDNNRKNYFFRLLCLNRNAMLWEHELYNNMEYVESSNQLHMFEGEDGIIAFNFANWEEAREMRNMVEQKIQLRRRKDERRARHIAQSQSLRLPNENNNVYTKSPNPEAKLAKRKRNITKADISTPMDFKHISHVGWDPNSGFDVNSQDEQLKKFLKEAGVSEKQLQDKDTREFIYDFINKHGGRDAVTEAVPPPAVPPRGPPRPSHGRAAPPPPPSTRLPQEPSTVKKSAPPPAPPAMQTPVSAAPNVPPPPPPPPMAKALVDGGEVGGGPAPPPPPPMIDNSALMDSIRNGTSLKPVEDRKVPAAEDTRSDLLSEIRKGCTLKPVTAREIKPTSSPSPNSSASNGIDLASALARALAERKKVIHSEDDDDDESGTSNDEDWD